MRGVNESALSAKTEKIWSELVMSLHFVLTFYLIL